MNTAEMIQFGGHTAKKSFWIALLSGFLVFGGLLTYFGLSGTVYTAALLNWAVFSSLS